MSNKWTKEQKWAIEARGGTVLVSAAAGSGKTAVLVERVGRLLVDEIAPIDADRLLIATFTKAAAAEMATRLSKKLAECIEKDPTNMRLRRQRLLLQKAHIGTIHSFCASCLREFFVQAGVAPDFRIVLDGAELKLMKQEILAQLVEERFEENEDSFKQLVDTIGEDRFDGAIEQLILTIDNSVSAFISPDKKLDEIKGKYKSVNSANSIESVGWLLGYCELLCTYLLRLYSPATEIVLNNDDCEPKLRDLVVTENDMLERLLDACASGEWSKAKRALDLVVFKTRPKMKGFGDEEAARFVLMRDRVKDLFKDHLKPLFNADEEEIIRTTEKLNVIVSELCELVREYRRRFAQRKSERKMLDPDDLEHMTAELLTYCENGVYKRTAIAKELSLRFDQILLDEYQDTNYTQDIIFRAVSREDSDEIGFGCNIFMVGDVKQSIYRFRKAAPDLFMDRMDRFSKYDPENPMYPAAITLGANFRSRKEVTETVNYVFSQLMLPERGGIDYNDGQQLQSEGKFAVGSGFNSEVHIISGRAAEENESSDIVEARYCARVIKKMLAEGFEVSDEGKLRPAGFGDFCIMRRSIKGGHGDAFISQMAAFGVPITIGNDSGFYDAAEVSLMLSMLRAINNPLNDIALTAVLRSPIFGFDCDMIAQLRGYGNKRPVYDNLIYAVKEKSELAEICGNVIDVLKRLRRLSCVMSADKLIAAIYRETGFLAAVQAMDGGEARKANLLQLQEQAREYEQSGFKGLSRFIRMIDRAIEQGDDEAAALVRSADSVSVCTIHSAKGLQYPICIISGLGSRIQHKSGNTVEKCVIFHNELGLGIKNRESHRRIRYKTAQYNAVSLRNIGEEIDESLRVLYVAMTRAIDKLIMVSTVPKNTTSEKSVGKLAYMAFDDGVDSFSLALHDTFAYWLLACAIKHPSAGALRELAAMEDIKTIDTNIPLDVIVVDEDDPMLAAKEEEAEMKPEAAKTDEEIMREIEARMNFKYTGSLLRNIPAKVTASEIHRHTAGMVGTKRPSFMFEKGLSPTERGTALHRYMQFCRLEDAELHPAQELERLVSEGYITQREGNAVRLDRVEQFFENTKELLAQATRIEREWRFTVRLEPEMYSLFLTECSEQEVAEKVDAVKNSDKPIVMQGECDLLLILKDEAIVIDYKTDYGKSADELKDEYGAQIRLYASAVKQVLSVDVKRCYIYSFDRSELISVDFSEN